MMRIQQWITTISPVIALETLNGLFSAQMINFLLIHFYLEYLHTGSPRAFYPVTQPGHKWLAGVLFTWQALNHHHPYRSVTVVCVVSSGPYLIDSQPIRNFVSSGPNLTADSQSRAEAQALIITEECRGWKTYCVSYYNISEPLFIQYSQKGQSSKVGQFSLLPGKSS